MYKTVDVQTHPQARPLRSRRWILASAVIAAVAVIGLLGTMTIRDRISERSEAPSGSPAASAQTRDLTPAELSEMWAAADAAFNGVQLPAASAQTRDLTPAELSEMWAAADAAFNGVQLPAASAQTRDLTPAELSEMWAAADAAFARLELPAAVAHVPAQATAEPDAAQWASVDHVTLTGG